MCPCSFGGAPCPSSITARVTYRLAAQQWRVWVFGRVSSIGIDRANRMMTLKMSVVADG